MSEVESVTVDASGSTGQESSGYSDPEMSAGYDKAIEAVTRENSDESDASGQSEDAASGDGSTPATQPSQPAAPMLTDDVRQLLQRFTLEESDLPSDPVKRAGFITNLRKRHQNASEEYQYRVNLENQLRQMQVAQQQAQTQTQQAQAWQHERLQSLFGDDTQHLQAAVQAEIQKGVQEARQEFQSAIQGVQAAQSMIWEMHKEQGLDAVRKLVPGISLDHRSPEGRANNEKLMQAAQTLLNANFDPTTYNARHAIEQAATSVFAEQIKLAGRKQAVASQKRAISGSPDSGGVPSRTKPGLDVDQMYDSVLKEQLSGTDKGDIEKMVAKFAMSGQR